MTNKKMILIWLIALICSLHLNAQEKEVVIPFSNPGGDKTLKVELFSGEIDIKGTTRKDILVKYDIEKQNQEDDSKHEDEGKEKSKGLKKISGQNVSFEMSEEDNEVCIRSKGWINRINLVIEVPATINLDINNQLTQEIKVENIQGNVNVENSAGSITLLAIDGIVNASTHAGEIKIAFDAVPEGKAMLINNTTGEIDITFPESLRADLKMKTNWGEIFSDLPIETVESNADLKKENEDGTFKITMDSWTHAKLNGGGQEVTIKTQMGNIYLRKPE